MFLIEKYFRFAVFCWPRMFSRRKWIGMNVGAEIFQNDSKKWVVCWCVFFSKHIVNYISLQLWIMLFPPSLSLAHWLMIFWVIAVNVKCVSPNNYARSAWIFFVSDYRVGYICGSVYAQCAHQNSDKSEVGPKRKENREAQPQRIWFFFFLGINRRAMSYFFCCLETINN